MIRCLFAALFAVMISTPAFAVDNGGFGAAFSNKPPSALAETPNSEIAQSVDAPVAPLPSELENIMPAAGVESDEPSVINGVPVAPMNKPEISEARDPVPMVPGQSGN